MPRTRRDRQDERQRDEVLWRCFWFSLSQGSQTALHAFATYGTWTRGYYFTEDNSRDDLSGEALPIPYGLRSIPVVQFANERRRGWTEAEGSPSRDPKDAWDERRNARMRKPQPQGNRVLCVESVGWPGGEFGTGQTVEGLRLCYSLESNDDLELLDDLQWADWSREGHMLAATSSGQLQIRNLEGDSPKILFEADLSSLEPNPTPPPAWAQHW